MAVFCKPKGGQQSRHLFIGNCGPAVGVSLDQISSVLASLGLAGESLAARESNQARVYASFASTGQAAAVLQQAAQLSAGLGGRQLVLKYAALEPEEQVKLAALTDMGWTHVGAQFACIQAQRVTSAALCSLTNVHLQSCAPALQRQASRGCSCCPTL